MGKKSSNYNVDLMQPDEVNELKGLVKEFVRRLENIDNELELLKEDRRTLIDEFKSKLDIKTLVASMKVAKIESTVAHKDTFDLFLEALREDS